VIGEAYAAMPESMTQQAGKKIENYAYGEERKKDAIPFAGITVMGNQADKVGNVAYMPKRGTAIEIDRENISTQIPFIELIKKLSAAGVEMTPKINQELRAKYGASIESKEVENIIETFTTKTQRHEERQALGKGEELKQAL
jgi:hypothetical protein